MYAYINGAIADLQPDKVTVDVQGVGYELNASANTLRGLTEGQTARLYTHLHLADGIMALYGFADTREREMFRKLLGVSRVGPKLALSVLSAMTPGDVMAAVVTENDRAFAHVSGMGKKTAQRVILELKELVSGDTAFASGPSSDLSHDIRLETVAALSALGYDGLSASRAVAAIEEAETVEEMLKLALRKMSGQWSVVSGQREKE